MSFKLIIELICTEFEIMLLTKAVNYTKCLLINKINNELNRVLSINAKKFHMTIEGKQTDSGKQSVNKVIIDLIIDLIIDFIIFFSKLLIIFSFLLIFTIFVYLYFN